MSILWRAAVSSKNEFKKVSLGPHLNELEKHIKEHIKADDPGSYQDFSIMLAEQKFIKDLSFMIIPHKAKIFENINFYEISIGRYKVFIKVDSRSIQSNRSSYLLQPNKPLLVPYLDFHGSITEKIIQDIIKINKKLIKKQS